MKTYYNKKPVLSTILALLLVSGVFSCKKKDKTAKTQDIVKPEVKAGDFVSGETIKVPLIAWGADIITINANGKSGKTVKGSLFHKAGLNIELFREDDFSKQVRLFKRGKIAYLRGTMGMINMSIEKLNSSPSTRPVIIFQHSWSAGGDALVVKNNIRSVKDLKGKTVAIQSKGPHVDYFLKLLNDARINPRDIKIMWTKDLVGAQGDTPMAKLYKRGIDAAFVIIPDALALTSHGKVGTGSEDSVKGAKILLSTKTANRIISDVYAVRKDYFDSNRAQVKSFVKAMLQSEEEVRDLFKSKASADMKNLLAISGKLLLDDRNAIEDVKGMYYDAEISAFNGNVKFFTDVKYPRNYKNLADEIQGSLISLGLLSRRSTLLIANWNYNELKDGLRYANKVKVSKFNPTETSIVAEKLSKTNRASLFSFEIFFKPNQNTFSASMYEKEFNRVIDNASTYGGALITVEGHSDPMGYLRKKKSGADPILLKKIKQAAKNLSYSRANAVREQIINYASSKGINLDINQFSIIGHGIEAPKHSVPNTKEEWQQNMRVQFKIIQVEAEEKVFRPL